MDVGWPMPMLPDVYGPNEKRQMRSLPFTLDQISALSQWANDDFGIVAGDDAGVQRNKLRSHYTV